MRWAVFLVTIVFLLSLDNERRFGHAAFVHSHRRSLSGLYLNAPCFRVFDALWNVRGARATVSVVEQRPFLYFIAGNDTTRLDHLDRNDIEFLQHIDFNTELQSLTIYDDQTITRQLFQTWKPNEKFLVRIDDADLNYIGTARIIRVQLDDDDEPEIIVQVEEGWYHTYLFYEAYGATWQLAGQVSIPDTRPAGDPDFSIPGMVGLTSYTHGTGIGILDNTYYTFGNGQLIECFSINSTTNMYLTGLLSDPYITLNAESNAFMVNLSEIFVGCTIAVKNGSNDSQPDELLYQEKLTYSLLRQPGGKYMPNKKIPGFNVADWTESCDSTHFYPEVYACCELEKLKKSGTSRQREVLSGFEYDSTACSR